MINSTLLTVVICTYDRDRLLQRCLDALNEQTIPRSCFKVLIVDNLGSGASREIAENNNARYVYESKVGVSHARNTGYQAVETEWLLFLDDDAVAASDLIEQTLTTISNNELVIVGGQYSHYFEGDSPRWVHQYYQKNQQATIAENITPLNSNEYLSIGIIAVRRDALDQIGGFDTSLGMSGKLFGYGEEDVMQDRLRELGYVVYYNPHMLMTHLVQPHKHTIKSRIQMAYAHGLCYINLNNNKFSYSKFFGECLRITFITIPYDIARWLFKKGFYWQNAVVSTATKYSANWGRLKGYISSTRKEF